LLIITCIEKQCTRTLSQYSYGSEFNGARIKRKFMFIHLKIGFVLFVVTHTRHAKHATLSTLRLSTLR